MMAAKPWLKLYTEILEDPKMGRLSDRLFRRVIEIFLLARKTSEDGTLPSLSDMAWTFRIPEDDMLTDLEYLASPGIEIVYEGEDCLWHVTNFEERQDIEVSASTERVRKFRAQKREIPTSETEKEPENIALHETECNVTETLHETTLREREEQEKEEEKEERREESRALASSSAFDSLKSQIDVVMGVPQGLEAVAVIRELEKIGAIPDDIRSAAAWYASRKKTIRTVEQLLGPVKTAILQRKQKGNGQANIRDPRSFITGEYAQFFKY
ncbi:MAG: hypothetical protein CVU46_10530 [Chloroflexi bacterium HGW-Chloroflexi-8]|nr:MAG: hypothetical protein CVU46_10530 [Chloroflexi bacterium HGW-Chloroflexi-8]